MYNHHLFVQLLNFCKHSVWCTQEQTGRCWTHMQCFMHIVNTTDFMFRYRHTFFKSCAHKIKRSAATRRDKTLVALWSAAGTRWDVEGCHRARIKLPHWHTHMLLLAYKTHTHTPTHTCNLQAEPEPISCEGNTQVFVIEYVYTQ